MSERPNMNDINRLVPSIALSAAVGLALSSCAFSPEQQDARSKVSASETPTTESAEVLAKASKQIIEEAGGKISDNADRLASLVYKPIKEWLAAEAPDEEAPTPASSILALNEVYGTDFGISNQPTPEAAADQLEIYGFVDVTDELNKKGQKYIPAGLVVVQPATDKRPFKLSISLRPEGEEFASIGHSLLGRDDALEDIAEVLDDKRVSYILADTGSVDAESAIAEAAKPSPTASATPAPSASPRPSAKPSPRSSLPPEATTLPLPKSSGKPDKVQIPPASKGAEPTKVTLPYKKP